LTELTVPESWDRLAGGVCAGAEIAAIMARIAAVAVTCFMHSP
jgi:hypothetical protein